MSGKLKTLEREYCSRNGIDPAEYLQNTAPADRKKIVAEMEEIKEQEKEDLKGVLRKARMDQYPDWVTEPDFIFDEKGKLISNYQNYVNALLKCPELKDCFSFDEYTQRFLFKDNSSGQEIEYTDTMFRRFYQWYEQQSLFPKCELSICREALKAAAEARTFNSATTMFDALIWDGVPRLETFFIDMLGAEDTPLTREMTKRWLVGAVQRIYNPGCQNENVLILTGPQGCGKSTTLKWLAGKLKLNDCINISATQQDVGQKLENCWFCCFDELATLGKKESAEYKNWLSINEDVYRAPYDVLPKRKPRHNVYCGTTNEGAFLKDNSDVVERRMWVIKCNRTSYEWSEMYRDKLTLTLWDDIWAEAVYIYKNTNDFSPYIDTAFANDFIRHQRQFKNYNTDNISDMLIEILNRPYYLDKNGLFGKGQDDMIRQIKNGYDYRDRSNNEVIGYVNYIPQGAVKRILNEVLKTKVKHDYMKNALDGTWCVKFKQSREGGKVDRYYVRGVWIDRETETIERRFLPYIPNTPIPDTDCADTVLELSSDPFVRQFAS